jgi:hypothetical protein
MPSSMIYATIKYCNINKMYVMSYSRKTNVLRYDYHLGHSVIARTSSIKDFGVFFDSKLYFHNHIDSSSLNASSS